MEKVYPVTLSGMILSKVERFAADHEMHPGDVILSLIGYAIYADEFAQAERDTDEK
jgi:hypothetical protein